MGTETSNSTIDFECSENPIMASTRIEDSSSMSLLRDNTEGFSNNSMSLLKDNTEEGLSNSMSQSLLKDNTLNEGFLVDSGSLSLSEINDNSASLIDVSKDVPQRRQPEREGESDRIDQGDDVDVVPSSMPDERTEAEMEVEGESIVQDSEEVEGTADIGENESNAEMELDLEDDDVDDEEENAPDFPVPQFPISRVKKIMSICLNTEEEQTEEPDNDLTTKAKEKKGRGTMIITKEAAYLMSLAAEYFVGRVGEMAGRITVSSKKKTMNLDHLKRALSDTDAFAFLEGCFQPSIIIGD